ncbi:MAG: GNAT family N-acetyltransferase [Candidatus Zixiibacteriota bacterium]|nr:MAG: GNAT family N-acetyltransferase [candidate division Zixibacteria bacterium]
MEDLKLRKVTASDSEFAFRVKKETLGKYIDQVWGWDETEQRKLHERRFATQEFSVIQLADTDVGILTTAHEHDGLRINQFLILPDHQRQGIGRACMEQIMSEAAASKYPVKLRVLKVNHQALAFFERLGFKRIGETDTHVRMEKLP